MSSTSQSLDPEQPPLTELSALCALLVDDKIINFAQAHAAENIAKRWGLRVADVLSSNFGVAGFSIARAYSTLYQCQLINPNGVQPDTALVDRLGAAEAIRTGILPWRKMGSDTVILTDKPNKFERLAAPLAAKFGPLRMSVTTRDMLESSVVGLRKDALSHAAEHKFPAEQSSRLWHAPRALRFGIMFCLLLLGALILATDMTIMGLCIAATSILILNTVIKAYAAVLSLQKTRRRKRPLLPPHACPILHCSSPYFTKPKSPSICWRDCVISTIPKSYWTSVL